MKKDKEILDCFTQTRVTRKEKEEVERVAEELSRTPSNLIRMIIKKFIDKHNKSKKEGR